MLSQPTSIEHHQDAQESSCFAGSAPFEPPSTDGLQAVAHALKQAHLRRAEWEPAEALSTTWELPIAADELTSLSRRSA